VQLHRDRKKFAAAGAELAIVGQGSPEDAAEFRRTHKLNVRILADHDRSAYRAAGTKVANTMELLGPKVVLKALTRSIPGGFLQTRTKGHAAQLGGVLVVDRDGSVVWSHLGEEASDIPPNDEVLAAVPDGSRAAA
jgi:peroxiredoxin